ncbi:MAG: prepilin-type N-terminal cleavage/methylation domain-containing protein [Elusimicrobiales bacterium]|jgi:prepilin-type N-terminal cleavage/methylation domain-containing protein
MRRGVTLMELMVVMGIMSALFAVAAPMLNQAVRNFIMARTKVELQQEARGIMYTLTRNLRQAKYESIVISRADANQPFCSKIKFTKDATTPGVSPDMVFQQEGSTLYQVIIGTGTNKRPLTRNLSYMAFTFPRSDDMGILSVSLTLKKNIYEGRTKALHMASEKVRIMNMN